MISKDAKPFRIDLWDQTKYVLKTKSGYTVKEIKVFNSYVEQPIVCAIEDGNGVTEIHQFGLDGTYSCKANPTSWDLMMEPIAPYVSDDFQIGPEGAYEHVEEVKMPIRESNTAYHWNGTTLFQRLYKETGKSVKDVTRAMVDSGCDYEKALKLLIKK